MEETPHSHRQALHAYDPVRDNAPTEECAEAMEAALADRELRQWWDAEQSFDRTMRAKLRQAPVPADLQDRILRAAAGVKRDVTPAQAESPAPARTARNTWHWSAFAGAAAAVMLLAVLYTFVLQPFARPTPSPEVQELMAHLEAVLVERSAPVHPENNYSQLVSYLEGHGAPTPKFLPAAFPQDSGFACANFVVDGVPVGMMCFKVDNGVYHIFTVDRANLPQQGDLPREVMSKVGQHCCATWTREDQLYILATEEPEAKVQTLL